MKNDELGSKENPNDSLNNLSLSEKTDRIRDFINHVGLDDFIQTIKDVEFALKIDEVTYAPVMETKMIFNWPFEALVQENRQRESDNASKKDTEQ